jgi:arylsulfatase A-like enzyme
MKTPYGSSSGSSSLGLSRRDVMAASLATGTTTLGVPALASAQKPNFLWLVSEDNIPLIGAYGDKLARTPTIDRLAKAGILYRNAYSDAPVCAPSRFAILTGVHPESCGPAHHMRSNAHLPDGFSTYPEILRAGGYFCTNNAKTDYNCDVAPLEIWDLQGKDAHWRKAPAGKPFMAVFNYETTHESQLFKRTPGNVTADQVRVPAYLPDDPLVRDDFASYYNLMERMDGQLADRLAELEADGLADDTIVFYYSDNGGVLPRSKRFCYDEGLRSALVVYIPPKWRHLSPHAPGSVVASPVSHISLAPTVVALAGLSIPAQMAGPPLLGSKARPPQKYAFGMRGRMDERIDFSRTVTDGRWRYIRNYLPHRPWGVIGAYQMQMKAWQEWVRRHLAGTLSPVQAQFFGPKPFEELYDLAADPDQVNNLANAKLPVMRPLSHALDRHMLTINDNGFVPEGMAPEGFFECRDRSRYPLPRLMRLAAMAARGDTRNGPRLRKLLASPHPLIRYWAATGLLILNDSSVSATDQLATTMRSDPVPYVRAVAAEALALQGVPAAVEILAEQIAPSQPWQLRLHALASLTALAEKARPALAAIEAAARDESNFYVRNAGRYLHAVLNNEYKPDYPIHQFEVMTKLIREGKIKVF